MAPTLINQHVIFAARRLLDLFPSSRPSTNKLELNGPMTVLSTTKIGRLLNLSTTKIGTGPVRGSGADDPRVIS
jgi:hypothetical protein